MRAGATGSAQYRHAAGIVQEIGEPPQFVGVGRRSGGSGAIQAGGDAASGFSATSPGITTTATPVLAMAVRIARSRTCGTRAGFEASSTKWLHSRKRSSGWVAWK